MDAHRQATNNTFLNELDVGKAVSDWTCGYNKKHTSQNKDNQFTGMRYPSVYMTVNGAETFCQSLAIPAIEPC